MNKLRENQEKVWVDFAEGLLNATETLLALSQYQEEAKVRLEGRLEIAADITARELKEFKAVFSKES